MKNNKGLIIAVVSLGLAIGGFFLYRKYKDDKEKAGGAANREDDVNNVPTEPVVSTDDIVNAKSALWVTNSNIAKDKIKSAPSSVYNEPTKIEMYKFLDNLLSEGSSQMRVDVYDKSKNNSGGLSQQIIDDAKWIADRAEVTNPKSTMWITSATVARDRIKLAPVSVYNAPTKFEMNKFIDNLLSAGSSSMRIDVYDKSKSNNIDLTQQILNDAKWIADRSPVVIAAKNLILPANLELKFKI